MIEHQRKEVNKILSSLFLIIMTAITGCDNGGGSSGGGVTIIDNRVPSNDITGVWSGPVTYSTRTATVSYNLTQSGSDVVTGTCSCSNDKENNSGTVTGTISDNSISFSQTDEGCLDIKVAGTVNGYASGSTMSLAATRSSGGAGCPAINLSYDLKKQ